MVRVVYNSNLGAAYAEFRLLRDANFFFKPAQNKKKTPAKQAAASLLTFFSSLTKLLPVCEIAFFFLFFVLVLLYTPGQTSFPSINVVRLMFAAGCI